MNFEGQHCHFARIAAWPLHVDWSGVTEPPDAGIVAEIGDSEKKSTKKMVDGFQTKKCLRPLDGCQV